MMKIKPIKILLVICIATLISVLAIIPLNKKYQAASWMKNVNDNTAISSLSIPGTHDSGATHSIFDVVGKCQDISIVSQLNIGVRFLDLRLQLYKNELKIVHSFVDQALTFESVLTDITSFIISHPTEFLIISIKEEASSNSSTISFDEKLKENLLKHSSITFDALPKTLGEARGKIYILNRFSNEKIGIPAYSGWLDSTTFQIDNLYIQDHYCISSLEVKQRDIMDTLNYAKSQGNIVLNYTSCYLDSGFPPLYAGTAAKGINPWLLETIQNDKENIGIVIVDFVTEELAKAIYMRNIIWKNYLTF